MSVIINGMEMPINCTRCPCSDDETRFCNAAKKYIPMHGKPKFCPLATIEERKTGKWIRGNKMPDYPRIPYATWMCYCSECKSVTMQDDDRLFDYCPNCGSYNGGENEV